MPSQWVPGSDVLAAVAGVIGFDDPAQLASRWTATCAWAARRAQQDISEILAAKGYTLDQLESFDYRVDYTTELAIFLAIQRNAPEKVEEVKSMDRRDQLRESLVIISGGVPVGPPSPAATDVGGISSGTLFARQQILDDACRRGWFS